MVMLFFSALTLAEPPPYAALIEAVRSGREIEATFFAMDPRVLTRVAVTPERLKEICKVRAVESSERVSSLLFALRQSRFTPARGRIDARFGIEVRDRSGQTLFWMSTDAGGARAVIGSQAYRVAGPVADWFRSEGGRWLTRRRRTGLERGIHPAFGRGASAPLSD